MTKLSAAHRQIAQLRMQSQVLAETPSNLSTPADVVRWMTAIQAQDFLAAKWAIGIRLPGIRDEDVEKDLAEARIVRSWPMRGTLHFVAAEDLGWILGLTTER